MLFRRLIERNAPTAWVQTAEVALLSAAAHSALIYGSVAGTGQDTQRARPAAETFSPAEYLIPKDRLQGMRPKQEKITWTQLTPTAGTGQAETPLGDQENLKFVKAKGEQQEPEVGDPIEPAEEEIALGDSIKTELQVDSAAVRYEDSAAPAYPESMLKKQIEGMVIVQYVVDTTGRADSSTFRVLFSTHKDFSTAVKNTLPQMRFRAAVIGSQRVKQLVQQPFSFKIIDTSKVARKP